MLKLNTKGIKLIHDFITKNGIEYKKDNDDYCQLYDDAIENVNLSIQINCNDSNDGRYHHLHIEPQYFESISNFGISNSYGISVYDLFYDINDSVVVAFSDSKKFLICELLYNGCDDVTFQIGNIEYNLNDFIRSNYPTI